jgi:hypothetical protein
MNTIRRMVANSPDGHVDGNAKMPMALKLSAMEGVKQISGKMLGAWCTTARPVGRPQ